jgi:hypothetical protein
MLPTKPRAQPETRVLDPRHKLLGFYMSGLAARPYMPNKETWQRMEIYYIVQDMQW